MNSKNFISQALALFQFQSTNNPVYAQYVESLGVNIFEVCQLKEIPFMPIDFFKTQVVKSGDWQEIEIYKSSGTTLQIRSSHYIEDASFYLNNAVQIFEQFYMPLSEAQFFALLPSYQEQGNSSLIKMVDYFMKISKSQKNSFYLNRNKSLVNDMIKRITNGQQVILFGVGYALLDLMNEKMDKSLDWHLLTIIETGGMKGRRKDMIKEEFYHLIRSIIPSVNIHSEYGMTELLSQAYAREDNQFMLPTQMRVMIRDLNDPFCFLPDGEAGGINIIDLANIHSCAFIETKDLGRKLGKDKFEILGQYDYSAVRGCNLMVV